MALIENLAEGTEPTFQLGDTLRTALTPGDTDAMTLSGLTVGDTYTLAITGLDPEATYTLTLHNGTHGTSISTGEGGQSNSMPTLFVTHDAGVMYVAFTVQFTGDYAMTLGHDAGTGAGGTTLADITVTTGNSLTFGNGDDYSSSNVATPIMDGMDGNDTIYGSSATDRIFGGAGDDFLYSVGNTTVDGGHGNDTLLARGGNDLLFAGAGNDTVQTFRDNSVIHGGTGDDTFTGSSTGDVYVFEENSGNDVIERFFGRSKTLDVSAIGITSFDQMDMADTPDGVLITFSPGNSLLLTEMTADQLSDADFVYAAPVAALNEVTGEGRFGGTTLDDLMTGSAANDTIRANDGNDEVMGLGGKDVLNGQSGDDQLFGGAGNDVLYGEDGNDTLDGGANNDRLNGGEGNDLLLGDAGNDRLRGDTGNDTLDGGAGKDALTGGAGADVFVFATGPGRDVITDFEDGLDRIDFSNMAGLADFGSVEALQIGADTVIALASGHTITLAGTDLSVLDAGDFIF